MAIISKWNIFEQYFSQNFQTPLQCIILFKIAKPTYKNTKLHTIAQYLEFRKVEYDPQMQLKSFFVVYTRYISYHKQRSTLYIFNFGHEMPHHSIVISVHPILMHPKGMLLKYVILAIKIKAQPFFKISADILDSEYKVQLLAKKKFILWYTFHI